MLKIKVVIGVAVLALGAASCGISEPEGCDICTTSAIVYGRVADRTGRPITDVQVDVRAFRDNCGQEFADGGTNAGRPRTDEHGRYTARLISLHAPFTARCFILTVNPLGHDGVPTDTVEVEGKVEFRADYKGPKRDSLRIDVVVDRGS